MEDDPWGKPASGSALDPWTADTKPDILSSERLKEFENKDVKQPNQSDEDWGRSDKEEGSSWNDEQQHSKANKPWSPSETAPVADDGWGAKEADPYTAESSAPTANLSPEKLFPTPIDSSNQLTPPSQTIPLSSPSGFPSPVSPSFSDSGFGGFTSSATSVFPSFAAQPDGIASNGQADDDDDGWGRMDIPVQDTVPEMPSWAASSSTADFGGEEEREHALDPHSRIAAPDLKSWDPEAADDIQSDGSEHEGDAVNEPTKTDQWEHAKQLAAQQESRAPKEVVQKLESGWRRAAAGVFGSRAAVDKDKVENGGNDVEGEGKGLDAEMERKVDGIVEELTLRPSSLNTFPTPLEQTRTHQLYIQSLNATPLHSSTSFLARASARAFMHSQSQGYDSDYQTSGGGGGGQTRSVMGLNAKGLAEEDEGEWNTQWMDRSRLGEDNVLGGPSGIADHDRTAVPTVEKPSRPTSGWGFWNRKSSGNIPLTTSGGGILEVKTMTPAVNVTGAKNALSGAATAKAVDVTELEEASGSTSKPAMMIVSSTATIVSPISVPAPATPAIPVVAQSSGLSNESEPAPTAVGRFFGRFRRSRTSTSPSMDLSNRDLQLSGDDLDFLSDVPAIATKPKAKPERGIADLLSLDGGEDVQGKPASLQDILSVRDTLSPPPPTRPEIQGRLSHQSISSLSYGSPHGAGHKSPPAGPSRHTSDLDMFADLDFNATGPVIKATSEPPIYTGSNLYNARASSPSYDTTPSSVNQPPRVPPVFGDDDGFGDFGDFSHSAVPATDIPAEEFGGFDDFGDFAEQSTISINDIPSVSSMSDMFSAPTPAPIIAPKPTMVTKLHEQNAAKLVSAAAAHTVRWPAPASPIPGLLSPPPKANLTQPKTNMLTTDFGYDSLPPKEVLSSTTSQAQVPQARLTSPLSASGGGGFDFLSSFSSPAALSPSVATQTQGNAKGGLSASDLSFFDGL